jgi:hypothetical protein
MALRQAGLIFRAETANSLAITPRMGEGFRIRRIFVSNPSGTLQHLLVVNDTARVGFFRVIGLGGGHLLGPRSLELFQTPRGGNLLDWMLSFENFQGYPVVQGESLTLSMDNGTADIFAIGDSYDAADVKSSEQCGSKSSDVLWVNYGTNLSALTTSGYYKVNAGRNPSEMVSFPWGIPGQGLVPAGKKMHISVIGGQACGRFASAGNTAQTQWLRPRVGTAPAQTILDRNDVGVPVFGTIPGAAGADYTSLRQAIPSVTDASSPYFNVLPALDFNGNDELALQVSVAIVGTGQLNALDMDFWTIQRIYPAS